MLCVIFGYALFLFRRQIIKIQPSIILDLTWLKWLTTIRTNFIKKRKVQKIILLINISGHIEIFKVFSSLGLKVWQFGLKSKKYKQIESY